MTIFAADSNARTYDYQGGDVGYVPAGFGTSPESTVQLCFRGAYFYILSM
jgi:hypothetical protein